MSDSLLDIDKLTIVINEKQRYTHTHTTDKLNGYLKLHQQNKEKRKVRINDHFEGVDSALRSFFVVVLKDNIYFCILNDDAPTMQTRWIMNTKNGTHMCVCVCVSNGPKIIISANTSEVRGGDSHHFAQSFWVRFQFNLTLYFICIILQVKMICNEDTSTHTHAHIHL